MNNHNGEVYVCRKKLYPPTFTICVLLYGDNLPLAERCLNSIVALPDLVRCELRIGMNDCSPDTHDFVGTLFKEENEKGRNVLLYNSTTNRGKYPVARWMFHDPTNPVRGPFIMWFDDDSYITTPTKEWLDGVEAAMNGADMCGVVMRAALAGNQHLWIQMQPWYNGKPLCKGWPASSPNPMLANGYFVPGFAVGGWWTVRTNIVNKLDWPPPNIIHRGGDFMFGEALRQNDMKLVNYADGVAVNASLEGASHKATRRGWDPLPVGIDYEPPLTVRLHEATKEIEPAMLDYPGL
jgi:GT2 family glycosyltransferase